MFESVFILGRQPALGIAELESLFGADSLEPFGSQACFVDVDAHEVDFKRIGGSTRVAKVLTELPSTKWRDIEKYLFDTTPEHATFIDGKLKLGISTFGVKLSKKDLQRSALSIKKAIKSAGMSVRVVPHEGLELNAASVLNNKLTAENGWELLIISDGKKAYLAQTVSIQDIDAYAARDRERPMRDAKVGMLPPKLAQVIINLARNDERINPQSEHHLLDPFCGTGVLVQEALLMGYFVHATDIDSRMIAYTQDNITWLSENYHYPGTLLSVRTADATDFQWIEANILDSVACETYLGKPLSALPPSDQLAKIMQEANEINHKFLQNIAPQLKAGTRLCVAVPTWRGKREFLHLSALDFLSEMGYTRKSFKYATNDDLIYHREGQVVGRELVVLEKE